MGLSYIYKKIAPQDFAIVPFNAHKQYNFTSASAASNQIAHYNTSYTSESISQYSSASSAYGSDTINNIKYNQLDHLFYRDYIKKVGTKKDLIDFLDNRRDLYEKVNILSIPSGLYGFKIKKSSFYLSSSIYEITDDSKGNLILSGTNVSNYPNDVQENVFRLDPIKGFKKYDLRVFDGYAKVTGGDYLENHPIITKKQYKQGTENPQAQTTYTTTTKFPKEYYPQDEDDSYFFNKIHYNNITFNTSSLGSSGAYNNKFSSINFNSSTGSFIKVNHNERFNFNTYQNFSISFYISASATGSDGAISTTEKRYILTKHGTDTIISSGSEFIDVESISPQYPYEIYMQSQSLYFARSDGKNTDIISGPIPASANKHSHVLCQISASVMQMYLDGNLTASKTSTILKPTKNKSNLYIGSKGSTTTHDTGSNSIKHFNGELSNINIWSNFYNATQIANISESINASPYIGNIFYESGFVSITHPKYYSVLSGSTGDGIINTLQFQGSHLIYEHEYQCTVQEHEFNTSLNSTALDQTNASPYKIAPFTTSSHFQPYVTTIGLYNENNELLVVGKLGQPIRISDQSDVNFIVRYDT
jgi:hypothetical protein